MPKSFANAIMLPTISPRVSNGLLACLLMFFCGSVFSLGVFTLPLEQSAHPPRSLDGVWPSSLALVSFVSIPITILTGFFLDVDAHVMDFSSSSSSSSLSSTSSFFSLIFSRFCYNALSTKTKRVRILALAIASCYAALAVVALGVQLGSALVIRLGAVSQAVPLGVVYLLATEILVRWNPHRPGFAVGLGQMALGSGAIVLAAVFQHLVGMVDCMRTLYISAMILSIGSLPPALFLRWPHDNELAFCGDSSSTLPTTMKSIPSPSSQTEDSTTSSKITRMATTVKTTVTTTTATETSSSPSAPSSPLQMPSERTALLPRGHKEQQAVAAEEVIWVSRRVEWRTLCAQREFWQYVFVTFTSSAPHAVMVFFFKAGHMYGQSSSLLLHLFQMASVLSTVFGMLGIFVTDYARRGSGVFFSGARTLMTCYLCIQTVAFVCLSKLGVGKEVEDVQVMFWQFMMAVMVLVTVMAACCGSAAVLARDVFGAENSLVVFGLGSGLGCGAGEGFGTVLMTFAEARATQSGMGGGGEMYRAFYVAAAVWSFVGMLCIGGLSRCEVAFEKKRSSARRN